MSDETKEVDSYLDVGNPAHFRILTMMNLGLLPEEIAATIKCSLKMVRRIAADPETPKHIETVKRIARCMTEINKSKFDELQNTTLEIFYEVLHSEKCTVDQKVRVGLAVLDRHPEAQYAKTSKNINREELEVGFSNDTMRMLKKIADKTNPQFIDVTPHTAPGCTTGRSSAPESDPSSRVPATIDCEVMEYAS